MSSIARDLYLWPRLFRARPSRAAATNRSRASLNRMPVSTGRLPSSSWRCRSARALRAASNRGHEASLDWTLALGVPAHPEVGGLAIAARVAVDSDGAALLMAGEHAARPRLGVPPGHARHDSTLPCLPRNCSGRSIAQVRTSGTGGAVLSRRIAGVAGRDAGNGAGSCRALRRPAVADRRAENCRRAVSHLRLWFRRVGMARGRATPAGPFRRNGVVHLRVVERSPTCDR